MKSKQEKKKKSSINNKIIWSMMILVTVIVYGILALYFVIQTETVIQNARQSIRKYLVNAEDYNSKADLYVYNFYVGGTDLWKEEFLDYDEAPLNAYYQEHQSELNAGQFYYYEDSDTISVFLLSRTAKWWETSMPENATYRLIYCPITYEIQTLQNNSLLFAALLAGVLLILFLVSRYTVHKLDEKDRQMKEFFANASHELKTPLMAIRGNADGIQNGYVETAQGCEVIEKEADRMSGLIGSILDISKVDSGMAKPDMTANDIREIIYDAAGSVMQEAKQRKIELQIDLPEPIIRDCDEGMLYSAFSNILSNDLRYADSLIQIRAVPAANRAARSGVRNHVERVKISFENDGTPISEEDRRHIFDRFYKGEKGQNGIGMALAQEYVKLHGSEILAAVRDGRTVFEIII